MKIEDIKYMGFLNNLSSILMFGDKGKHIYINKQKIEIDVYNFSYTKLVGLFYFIYPSTGEPYVVLLIPNTVFDSYTIATGVNLRDVQRINYREIFVNHIRKEYLREYNDKYLRYIIDHNNIILKKEYANFLQ